VPPVSIALEHAQDDDSAAAASIRIIIVDEHPIFRVGLRRLLETRPRLQIVGEAGDGLKAVALVRDLAPDILLIGLGAGRLRLDVLERIADLSTPVRTILLTRAVGMPGLMRALQLGACGIVPKDSAADVLFESIDCVMAGQYWVGVERAADLVASVRQLELARRRVKAFGLTHRELEILRGIVGGDTNRAIARTLSISENTVKRHILHIFDKVGASNRVELALFATHHQLVDVV